MKKILISLFFTFSLHAMDKGKKDQKALRLSKSDPGSLVQNEQEKGDERLSQSTRRQRRKNRRHERLSRNQFRRGKSKKRENDVKCGKLKTDDKGSSPTDVYNLAGSEKKTKKRLAGFERVNHMYEEQESTSPRRTTSIYATIQEAQKLQKEAQSRGKGKKVAKYEQKIQLLRAALQRVKEYIQKLEYEKKVAEAAGNELPPEWQDAYRWDRFDDKTKDQRKDFGEDPNEKEVNAPPQPTRSPRSPRHRPTDVYIRTKERTKRSRERIKGFVEACGASNDPLSAGRWNSLIEGHELCLAKISIIKRQGNTSKRRERLKGRLKYYMDHLAYFEHFLQVMKEERKQYGSSDDESTDTNEPNVSEDEDEPEGKEEIQLSPRPEVCPIKLYFKAKRMKDPRERVIGFVRAFSASKDSFSVGRFNALKDGQILCNQMIHGIEEIDGKPEELQSDLAFYQDWVAYFKNQLDALIKEMEEDSQSLEECEKEKE